MSGSQRGFNFGRPYTPASGSQRGFNFGGAASQTVEPAGPDTSLFGLPSLSLDSTVVVADVTLGEQGYWGVSLLYRTLPASGWASSAFGPPNVRNTALGVFAPGIAPPPQTGPAAQREVPPPWVSFWTRTLNLNSPSRGIPPPAFPTTHVIAFDTQFIDLAGRGLNTWGTGTARVEFTTRYVSPPFIASNVFGSHNVARIQVASPTGWESGFVSQNHELDINLQRILHHSGAADPATYGVLTARNQFELATPLGWVSSAFAPPIVHNVDQYVFVAPYMGTNGDPTQWPNYYPFVENQHRYVGPSGWQSSRFSIIGNIIENTAAPLLPPGLDATLWGPETFIAHRIRYVGPEGWDSFYNTHYTVVYNGAVVLAPQGWDSARVGTPGQVGNLNRTVKHVFPYGGETVGTAFIAYRVRTVYPGLFYDVPSGFPEVRFNPYPVSPTGISPPQFGGHTVFERFTIFYPPSVNVHNTPWVGQPNVENRNKTLLVFPSDQSIYGIPKVSNFDTHVSALGSDVSVWGAHLIAMRTRTITAAPVSVPVFSVTHQVRNVLPDPPSRQLIAPPGTFTGNTEGNPGIVPAPLIRLATFYPIGFTDTRVGQHEVRSNTIIPQPWPFNLDQFGTPTLVYTQYILPEVIPWPNREPPRPPESSSDQNWVWAQRPRVSPHTIYAPSSDQATEQARDNHPPNTPHVVDHHLSVSYGQWSRNGGWPFFGRPDISNRHRTIGPVPTHYGWSPTSRIGEHELTLRRRFVYPNPIVSLRMGTVSLWGVTQFVDLSTFNDGIPPLNSFGGTTVAPPPPPPLASPSGFIATLWGTHRVELFIRDVLPQGIPHRGNPQQGLTNPWGLPLVGFPRVYQWGGYDLTLWGTAWVSHRNRELPVEGWNSLSLEDDDLGSFADRMRVRRRNPSDGIVGIGPDSAVGNHAVTHFVRTILGRGISGYNSGDHIVKTVSGILPAGWDSLEVGDIDRWEAGKIKPYGDDLSIMGTPRMLSPLRPSGPAGGAVGAPRIGVPLYLLGIPEIGFAGPSVSNPFGCTNRVVTPLPILSQQNVPQPVVT